VIDAAPKTAIAADFWQKSTARFSSLLKICKYWHAKEGVDNAVRFDREDDISQSRALS